MLAISPEEDEDNFDENRTYQPLKMSKAEFLIAQLNLDVIESHGSQELQMSTQ